MTALTHKQRVLALLGDGKPHSYRAGYRLSVMLHSRVADLRRDGYRIACWRDQDDYLYQLLEAPLEAPAAQGPRPQSAPPADASSGRPPTGSGSEPPAACSPPVAQPAPRRSEAASEPPPLQQLSLDIPRGAYEVVA